MAAASAAGVGMLALAKPAEAKVVYTPANIAVNSSVLIDLNNDGIADFELIRFEGYGHSLFLAMGPQVKGNAIRSNGGGAACGFFGVPVGAGEKFGTTSYFGHGVYMARFFQYSHSSFTGPWANATNRYLGLRLVIDGQTHYGWARVTATQDLHNVVLTGYAYETTPNKTIIEGHTSGPEKAGSFAPADLLAPAPEPATLALLARGADVLSVWRRDEQVVTR